MTVEDYLATRKPQLQQQYQEACFRRDKALADINAISGALQELGNLESSLSPKAEAAQG